MSTKPKAGNGEGSIRRDKNGRYVVELSIGRRPDGTRRRIRRTAPTLAEAKKLRTTLLAQQQSGTLVEHSAYTLRSFGLMWSREIKTQTVRATTAADYEYRLRQYVFPYLGSVRLVDLTPQHVQRWMNSLVDAKRSPNTINGARRILYGLCKYAERQGLIGRNPVAATDPIHRRNGTTQVREPWTREETAKVLKAAVDNDDLDCFLHLMLHCGLRPGEALALRWSDIDEERHQLWVRGTLKQARHILPDGTGIVRLQRNAPKTKHSERPLAISETVASALERQRIRQQQMQETLDSLWQRVPGEDYIIT
ncbi:MAG: tyrosine-type recombinase/integrase, partial [Actinomycetales bacterium]|nr:tyrosine-type recombinase/integrase [Actinomycetales bacterium]